MRVSLCVRAYVCACVFGVYVSMWASVRMRVFVCKCLCLCLCL